jgi:hypothetical protein
MRLNNRARLSVQPLDNRINPATFSISHSGSTLVIHQGAAAIGGIDILDDPASGTVSVDDTGDANPPTVASTVGYDSLSVKLNAADTTLVTYDILSTRTGSVTLDVDNVASRELFLAGGYTIGGNLKVVGGKGALNVAAPVDPVLVDGNATFVGGKSLDSLDLAIVPGSIILGRLTTTKFNTVLIGPGDTIGGNLTFNDAGDANTNVLDLSDTEVGGNFSYVGGSRNDTIVFDGTTAHVEGKVTVNFGSQLAGDTSFFVQNSGSTSIIDGDVRVTGGKLGSDDVVLQGTLNGNIQLNLGNGANLGVIEGTFHGSTIRYSGGSGVDTVGLLLLAGSSAPKFNASLGAGNDTMQFGGAVDPAYAYVNFGSGVDTLTGAVVFAHKFVNLP